MGVRHEKVILSMEDQVSTKAAQAAASVMLLDKSLDGLSGRAVVTARATTAMSRDLDAVPRSAQAADRSINQLTGRLAVFRDLALTLGPALNPVGGVLIAGVGGLANQLGVAALAGGSMVVAFQGVGDALKAVNEAALEPTTDNLAKAQAEMEKLSPAAREAVRALSALRPTLQAIRDAGAEGLFPGLTAALDSLEDRAPEVARIVQTLNETTGTLLAQGAGELQSTEWDDFFDFLATDARDTLDDLGRSVGFLASGLADMWMAFDPLNDDFSDWALNASRDFAEWADSLRETEGFAEFVDYVRETGPQVADTFSAMGDALLQVIQATAPLGGPALAALEAVSKVVAAIADSDLGTPIFAGAAALAVLNRSLAATAAISARMQGGLLGALGPIGKVGKSAPVASFRADVAALSDSLVAFGSNADKTAAATGRMRDRMVSLGKTGGVLAGVGLAATGAADGLGITNTASLALVGTIAGPWGAAIGGGVGALMDMRKASGDAFDALDRLGETLERMPAQASAADFEFLNAQLDAAAQKVAELQEMRDSPFSSAGAFLGSIKNDIEDTFGASDIEEAERALAEYEEQAKSAKWEAEGLSGATGTLESRTAALAATTQAEADALRDAVDAMRAKRSEAIRAFNAETNYHAAIDEATDSLRENGRTLDVTTEQGRANRTALAGMAAAWNDLSDEEKNAAGGSRQARKAFVDTAEAMGMTRTEARRLARELFEIPTKRFTDVAIKGDDEVIAQARAIRAQLDAATRDRHVNVTVSMPVLPSDRKIAGGVTRNADGGVWEYFADGGVRENHVAQIAPANTVRVWAEPETEGEAYIPFAPSKRTRSVDIWRETGRRLGVLEFANGGTFDPERALLNFKSARGSFDLDGGMKVAAVGRELLAFEKAVKSAGGTWTKAMREQGVTARSVARRYNEVSRALEKNKEKLDELVSNRDSIRDTAAGSFNNSPFGKGLSGLRTQLEADRNDANKMTDVLKWARKKGLDGPLYEALAQSGDLNTATQLSKMSRTEIDQYERLYASTQSARTNLANTAAIEATKAVNTMSTHVQRQTATLDRLDKRLDNLEARIEAGAARGTKAGIQAKARTQNAKVKAK